MPCLFLCLSQAQGAGIAGITRPWSWWESRTGTMCSCTAGSWEVCCHMVSPRSSSTARCGPRPCTAHSETGLQSKLLLLPAHLCLNMGPPPARPGVLASPPFPVLLVSLVCHSLFSLLSGSRLLGIRETFWWGLDVTDLQGPFAAARKHLTRLPRAPHSLGELGWRPGPSISPLHPLRPERASAERGAPAPTAPILALSFLTVSLRSE